MMELIVEVKYPFGERRVYPLCSKALLFAEVANTTTLTDDAISAIKDLGYTFKVEAETV
jgi:hypothetical protein